MPTIPAPILRTYIAEILTALETPVDLAEIVSTSLVGSNLAGHDSHGVILVPSYAGGIRAGAIKPAARASVEPATGMLATLAVDGAWGWGPPAAYLATDKTIARAQEFGIAAAVIHRCHHIGRVGQYGERIASHNLIGIVTCNAGPGVTPYGGKNRMLGTNPIAIAAPRSNGQAPVLYDGSTSVVAGNKLAVLRDKGLPAPQGWIVDGEGQPSVQPSDFFEGGALLPLGGHKGYALGVMVELLGGLLSLNSAAFLPDFKGGNGVLVMAIRPDAFLPLDDYLGQVERACAALKAASPLDPARPVLLPGEPEEIARRERTAQGIPLPEATWQSLQTLGESLGVAMR